VELYADGSPPERHEMKCLGQETGEALCHVYHAAIAAIRPATDYTARVMPYCAGVAIPLESGHILWQG